MTPEAIEKMIDDTTLSPFDGMPVVQSTVKITGAGDGLSSSLGVDPHEWKIGEEGYLVVHYKVADVKYSPVSKDHAGVLSRDHNFRVLTVAHTDAPAAKKAIRDTERKINEARGRREITNADGTQHDGWEDDPE